MKFSIIASLVFSAIAVAQTADDIPACAMPCFAQAIGTTDCSMTDYYCQCGAAQQQIYSATLSCLCSSTCSATDLLNVYQTSNSICSAAFKAHGETYTTQPPDLKACASSTGAAASVTSGSSSGSAASASATSTSSSTASSSESESSDTPSSMAAGSPTGSQGMMAAVVGMGAAACLAFLAQMA